MKKGVESTPSGWICGYADNCKTVLLEYGKGRARGKNPVVQRQSSQRDAHIVPFSQLRDEHHSQVFNESDFDEDQVSEGWNGHKIPGDQAEIDDVGEEKELAAVMNMKEGDKKDITGKVSAYIDMSKYYVFTIAKANQAISLWEDREKSKNRGRYSSAIQKSKSMSGKTRVVRASFARGLLREGGWKACAERARERHQWRSVLVSNFTVLDKISLLSMLTSKHALIYVADVVVRMGVLRGLNYFLVWQSTDFQRNRTFIIKFHRRFYNKLPINAVHITAPWYKTLCSYDRR